MSFSVSTGAPSPIDDHAPQLSDVRRYGRYVVRRFVSAARAADRPTFRRLLIEHLGNGVHELPVTLEQWPAYEHVNVQGALDVILAEHGNEAEVIGVAGHRHRGPFGIADLIGDESHFGGPQPGNVTKINLPSGPGDRTRECLSAAVILLATQDHRMAVLLRGPDPESGLSDVTLEIIATRPDAAEHLGQRLRQLALEHNVYRGQVVSFGHSMFGERSSLLRFRERPTTSREELILPATTFEDLRRQVVGVARNRTRLRAAGQHLKRGMLLYGPPGVGKTHSVRYLISELVDTTVVELTGETLHGIREACSVARALQPAMIVVEDVDLIAEERSHYGGETPLLFTLLNEMDGLDEDADVVFLLTTNRADLLEPALASRPGRVDQAVHIPLPDRDSRRRLVELYRGALDVDLSRIESVLERTNGVTASFLKELLRRAAVVAADREDQSVGTQLQVTADDLDTSLDDLLDTRNQMTRAVLGYRDE
ncbi:AAA family ATPase [Nocardioides sp. Bht2]|uniref:AAA family ATPase n=1 Tax=Nocardioides sp. Bht2 TaxID=3392297 RepID=UPI0039B4F30B